MTSTSKLAILTAIVSLSIAPTAFAQSFDPEVGSGNIVPGSVAPAAPQTIKLQYHVSARQSGLRAFAMVPGGATDPSATGGGSTGYNAMLLKY